MKNIEISRLVQRFDTGQMNRRDFIRNMIALGVSVSSATMFASTVQASTPKRGGRLRQGYGSGQTTDTLNPGSYENFLTISVGYTLANNLTEVAPDGSLIPELAESFESEDGKTWHFKIREGVEFHNGKSVTADDVLATFDHHMNENSTSVTKGLLSQSITGIRKDGSHHVVFELNGSNRDFPYVLSDYNLGINAATSNGKIDPHAGMGSGPYSLVSFDPGVRIEYKRNPNYWKEDRAWFDEVESISILDKTARQNAIMNGDVDVIDGVDPTTVHLLSRAENIKILETTGTEHRTTVMRLDTPPFDNADVRMALKLSVKRQELVDKVMLGHGALGNDHHISPAQQYWNSELPQREYDPDKARYHIKKAGLEGVEIELHSSDAALPGALDAALLHQASAAVCGINIKVTRQPADGYWSNVWNKPGMGWVSSAWSGRPTCDWMFSACCTAETDWNDSAWKTTESAKRFNQLVVAARSEGDPDKRRQMYWECQELLHNDGGTIVWGFSNYLAGLGKNLMHHQQVSGAWALDGARACERWWFA